MIKMSYSPKSEPNIGEVAYSERTKAHRLSLIGKIWFFSKSKFH